MIRAVAAALLALSLAACASEPPPPPQSAERETIITRTATVVDIDRVSRQVLLRGQEGNMLSVTAVISAISEIQAMDIQALHITSRARGQGSGPAIHDTRPTFAASTIHNSQSTIHERLSHLARRSPLSDACSNTAG